MKFSDYLNEAKVNPFASTELSTEEERLDALEKMFKGFSNNDYAAVAYKGEYTMELHSPKRGYVKAIMKNADGETLERDTFDSLNSLKKFIKQNGF